MDLADTPDVGENKTAQSARSTRGATTDAPELADLTARELEVLTELAKGLTNREIVERLFISERTVSVHVSHILSKIGARTRVQASAILHRVRSMQSTSDAYITISDAR